MSSICLNMIVKNEEHIITQCFESLYKANLFIKEGENLKELKQSKITRAVICDTGSDTDKCTNVIKEWFSNHNIPCDICNHEWSDFGTNRSLALKECLGKSDYIFVIDADDVIEGTITIPKLNKDCYTVKFGKTMTYYRTQLFKNTKKLAWKYVGVLHEYPEAKLKNVTKGTIEGDYYVDSRRLGARSQDPKKYLNDALVFERELKKDPTNARNVFYMAQSYFDYGEHKRAIEVYEKRISMGGWYEEVYYSMKRIGDAHVELGHPSEQIESAYMRAYNSFKHRSEPLFCLARYYRKKGDYKKAYKYGKLGLNIPFPKDDLLFVDKHVYEYSLKDEVSISSYYVGNYLESSKLCNSIISTKEQFNIHQDIINRTKQNLELANNKLKNLEKPIAVIHTGNINSTALTRLYNIIDKISIHYRVFVVGNVDANNKNTNYILLDIPSLKILSIKEQISTLIMFNSPTFLLSNKDIVDKAKRKILWQLEHNIYYQLNDGLKFNCYSKELKQELFNNVDLIVYDNDDDKEGLNFKMLNNYLSTKTYIINNNHEDYSFMEGNEITHTSQPEIHDTKYNFEYPSYIISEINKDVVLDLSVLTLCNILKNSIEMLKTRPEPMYELSKVYMKTKRFKLGVEAMDNAMKCIEELEGDNNAIKDLIDTEYAKNEARNGLYQKAFNRLTSVLRNSTIDDELRRRTEIDRDACIKYFKDSTLKYPEKIIKKLSDRIKNNQSNLEEHKIALSMTTCKRYDLFEKTINSFINCCKRPLNITKWICVDDNSTEEDREKMRNNYPFFEFIMKDEKDKGHYKSMNIILDKLKDYKVEYLLHLEDDFHFVEKLDYISDCISILDSNKELGQVVFNVNYGEVGRDSRPISGGIKNKTEDELRYVVHSYNPNSSLTTPNCEYYPNYSLRPSVLRTSSLFDVGYYMDTERFEFSYAEEYTKKGYKTGFLDTISCLHIGKKTWERDVANAYNLNDEKQFGSKRGKPIIYAITNNGHHNSWSKFKGEIINSGCDVTVENIEIIDKVNIGDDDRHHLIDLDYETSRYIMTHKHIWQKMANGESNNVVVIDIRDDMVLKNNMLEIVLECVNKDEFGCSVFGSYNDGDIGGYIISKEYATKLLELYGSMGVKIGSIKDAIGFPIYGQKINRMEKLIEYGKSYNTKKIYEDDTYLFYRLRDSFGEDIGYIGKVSVEELKKYCDENDDCVGFNTLGFVKHTIKKPDEFIDVGRNLEDGLYVRKDRYEHWNKSQ